MEVQEGHETHKAVPQIVVRQGQYILFEVKEAVQDAEVHILGMSQRIA